MAAIYSVTLIKPPSQFLGLGMQRHWVGYDPSWPNVQGALYHDTKCFHKPKFTYLVVEQIKPGLPTYVRQSWWFCWDDPIYVQIPPPWFARMRKSWATP
jgi:hypothetical protein